MESIIEKKEEKESLAQDLTYVTYVSLCPVCNKELSIEEIKRGICSNKNISFSDIKDESDIILEEYEKYFYEHTKKYLRSIQRLWAKKIIHGRSFSIEAPTGSGKTLFGISMAAFLSTKNKKSYIIVPTTSLVNQIKTWFEDYFSEVNIVFYHGDLSKKEKEEMLERINNKDFSVLVTTSAFLTKNYEHLRNMTFDFVFVDDLDAVLKTSRNVDKILSLINFDFEEIKKAKVLHPDRKRGILVISTATTKQGRASLLFRSLLGFDVSQSYHTVRNVDDYYMYSANEKDIKENILKMIKKLGKGGIIFVPTEETAKILYEYLKEKGINIGLGISSEDKDIELFLKGELDVIIGIAVSYGKLVRGIDAPLIVRYALFYQVPGFKVYLKDIDDISDRVIVMLINTLKEHPLIKQKYYEYINKPQIAKEVLKEIFKKREFKYASRGVVVKEDYIFFPDLRTYLQATGRTSRMYSSGITKGISIIFDDKEHLDALFYRGSFYDIDFMEISEERLKKSLEDVIKTREEYIRSKESKEIIKPFIFVVESPTKAKQISRFYGKPAIYIHGDQVFYEISTGKFLLIITASLGHVVDLISNGFVYGVEVDKQNGIIRPYYGSIKKCPNHGIQFVDVKPSNCKCENLMDSKRIITNLMQIAKDVAGVIVATDPDSEGEKIAWDIGNFTRLFSNVYRAEFHEVTKRAIDNALENLREINENLVRSQIVRRVEDRWIGYALTSLLRKEFQESNISAGRVQTPVLGWIIDRYKKNKEKINVYYLSFENNTIQLGNDEEIGNLNDLVNKEVCFEIKITDVKEKEKIPLPPYSTNEILKDISRILKIPADESMKILQDLFENGLITYHRTDSTRVSDRGLNIAKIYLGDNAVPRTWSSGEEGAHECIRPTKPISREDLVALLKEGSLQVANPLEWRHLAVYDLIFRRFMASQSPPYKEVSGKVKFILDERIEIEKEIIFRYEGLAYALYPYIGIPLDIKEGKYKGKIFSRKISKYPLYTEADVISLMKERGIGRPSTYATILQKLYKRNYIIRKNNRLIPTQKGMMVYDFLKQRYYQYISEETTRKMEKVMDEISDGKENYLNVLFSLYDEIMEIERSKS